MYNQKINYFEFDEEKAIEAILYITKIVKDKYKALKILYLADLIHLEKYGRLIYGDEYARLDHGITPSKSYDLVKSQGVHNKDFVVKGNNIINSREPNLDYLSKTDVQCLDASIEENKDLSFQELKKKTHDDDIIYNASNCQHFVSITDLVKGVKNSEEISRHLKTLYS
jgi:hypothetical protein